MSLRILRSLMIVAGMGVLLTSCRTDDLLDMTAGRGEALQISVTAAGFAPHGFGMRADDTGYTTTFAAGDQIGITAVKNGTIILNDNIPYEYNGLVWNPVNFTNPVEFHPETYVSYLVYYPYDVNMTGKTTEAAIVAAFSPQANQSNRTAYNASDLMTGTGVLSGTILSVTLTHALSLIDLHFPAAASSVTFEIDSVETLTPYFFEGAFRYIAKPQNNPIELTGSFMISSKTMHWQLSDVTLTAGKYTRLNIFVPSIIEGYKGDVQVFYTDGSDETTTIASNGFLKLVYGTDKTIKKIVLLAKSNKEYLIGRTTDRPLCLKFDTNGDLLFRPAVDGYIPIGSYAEFQKIHNNATDRAKNYRQEADLDLMNIEWRPIGDNTGSTYYFKGIYDGNNKTISRLKIYSAKNCIGLFGYVSGTVQNLSITDADVTGNDYVAGIAGFATGIITNCSNSGTIKGANKIGGIVGDANSGSTITNCRNNGTIIGGNEVGGIVGYTLGSNVEACENSGTISGTNKVGGVVGHIYSNSTVSACKNSGNVSGTGTGNMTGGVAGEVLNSSVLRDSYSTSASVVTGYTDVGGVVGCVTAGTTTGLVENCYSASIVSGYSRVGGVAGLVNSGALVRGCVALNPSVRATNTYIGRVAYQNAGNLRYNLALETISNGGGIPFVGGIQIAHDHKDGKSITSGQAMMRATYETYIDSDFPIPLGWNFSNVWTINEGNGYPTLQWE